MNTITKTLIFLAVAISHIHATELPNILWLTSEDNGPHLGCYGDKYADTPNLDGLAAKGMIYTRAISNAPVCAPARTTIISGMYPTSTGAEHMRSMTQLPKGFKMYPVYLRELGYYCTNNSKEDYNLVKDGEVWNEGGRKATWTNRPNKDQPFFAIHNFTVSHESQIRKRPHQQIHDPSKVRVPAYHPDTPEVRQDWAQYYDKLTEMDKMVGEKLELLKEQGMADNTIIFYFGDHGSGMPRSKRWPYFSGINVPLIIHVPEKWKHLASSNYKVGGKSDNRVGFVDLAPTLLSIAGKKPPVHMQGHAFMGKHQTSNQEYGYGFRGRMDERYDMVRSVVGEKFIYIRNYMPHKPYGQHVSYMFQTPTTQVWKKMFEDGKLNQAQSHFWKTKPAEELYDLQKDPDEVLNLAKSSEHAAILKKMRSAHLSHIRKIRDIGFLPEGEIHLRAKGSTPYEIARDSKKYPFEKILAAAELATSLKKKDLPKIAHLLKDNDSAVRYWGTIGLLTHKKSGTKVFAKELVNALNDKSPYVRATAAEALGRYGSKNEQILAVKTLGELADPIENGCFPSMLAMNAIDHLDNKAKPILSIIKSMPRTPEGVDKRFHGYVGRLIDTTVKELEGK
jgi:arylsulfatase A-like enzyme